MSAIAHRKGWCPGALRPMESGDGLIIRLKIVGGMLSANLARALAACAETYGNGLIDLSARANLQLRGVSKLTLPALQARLDALGLLDADPEAEAIRNILASPLAGLDPSALLDIRPLVQALDARLRSDHALHRLSGKFLFLIDDGGCLPLPCEKADVAFVATAGPQGPFFAVHLAGLLMGRCAVDDLCEIAARLAYAFLQASGEDRRMIDLVQRIGADAVARAANLDPLPHVAQEHANDHPHCAGRILGFHALGRHTALGVGIAFGRLDAAALRRLADAAEAAGGTLHLSPWRAILIVAEQIGADFADRLRYASFILDDDAPIRAVAACSGRPACLHGETASQADGAQLASLAKTLSPSGIALHVSACAKGCAYQGKAPVTLIGRDGAYDLVLDGRAGDKPLLRGLDLPAIESMLQKLVDIAPPDRATFARRLFCEIAR
jgi:precorrin-3B synthase